MSNQMLSDDEWARNVGTAAFPVSFLHEYAVGMLWDALQNRDEVIVKTIDGNLSGNLKEGVERVVIPDAMQPIGGCIPDLALLDKNLRPVRVIEVVVTSPPTPTKNEKLAKLQQRGVEVVIVPVRNEEDLKGLCLSKSDDDKPNWAYQWNRRLLDQIGIINIPRQTEIVRGQQGADRQVEELIDAVVRCRPEVRRRLAKILQEVDSLDSCYPLSPNNPKGIADHSKLNE